MSRNLECIKKMAVDTITANDVGEILGISPQAIRDESKRGNLPFAISIGSRCIIPRERFVAFMEGKDLTAGT